MSFGSDLHHLRANMVDSRVLSTIVKNPTILGLGNVRVVEPVGAYLGKSDTYLLLSDFGHQCYEVLAKRRCTITEDLHHVVNFSNEMRMRFPDYEHCAVLVVEELNTEVTDRARTLCEVIPLVVIRMQSDYRARKPLLSFTKLFDQHH